LNTPHDALIETQPQLEQALGIMSGPIAVDTEFVRERTYYPQLCLLQISDADTAVCIDCLAELELVPVRTQLLERPMLMHSGRQDLEILWQTFNQLPQQLVDTQVAAGLLGMTPQVGYGELVDSRLSVKLDKSNSRRDWTKRPLPADGLRYALDDVRYLIPLWQILADELEKLGRLDWFVEDCQRLLNPELYDDPRQIFSKLKGLGRLEGNAQACAYRLVLWRETHAQKRNRPRRWILADRALLQIAAQQPGGLDELEAIEDVGAGLVRNQGENLLGQIAASPEAPPVHIPRPLDADQRRQHKQLAQRLGHIAEHFGVRSEILATRGELETVVRGQWPGRLASGWRRDLLDSAGLLDSSGVDGPN
jgi:ribonuclease D